MGLMSSLESLNEEQIYLINETIAIVKIKY